MKKTLSLLMVTALVLSACGGPVALKDKVENKIDSKVSQKVDKAKAVKRSLKDLLTLGTAQKCQYNIASEGVTNVGEILISGKKFRQITKLTIDGNTTTVSALGDGEFMYTWNDQVPNSGIKMKLDFDQAAAAAGQSGKQSLDFNGQYDYDCSPATVTDADFAVPTNVKFMDLGDVSKFKDLIK